MKLSDIGKWILGRWKQVPFLLRHSMHETKESTPTKIDAREKKAFTNIERLEGGAKVI